MCSDREQLTTVYTRLFGIGGSALVFLSCSTRNVSYHSSISLKRYRRRFHKSSRTNITANAVIERVVGRLRVSNHVHVTSSRGPGTMTATRKLMSASFSSN